MVAGLLSLDLFGTVLGGPTAVSIAGIVELHPGVALTGILVGLGSSPTHEVVRLLTEIKKNRRAENERL